MPTVKLDETLEMYYEDDDYTDPWRTPETIVLHHGNGKNARLWYAWVPLLARQYRVIRVDARGFGRSSVPPKGKRILRRGLMENSFAHSQARRNPGNVLRG